MQRDNTTKEKIRKGMMVKVTVDQPVSVCNVLFSAVEAYSAKSVIKQLFSNCLMESAYSTSPLLGMISNEKETNKLVENAEAADVLSYVVKHWDELQKLGKKEIEENLAKNGIH